MVAKTPMLFAMVIATALGSGGLVYGVSVHREPGGDVSGRLTGDDFGRIRKQALGMFPRGSPIAAASAGLIGIGFHCAPARHMLANINAPSVECDSAGRGYPIASRMQITVMARNGMVSDIAVGNGFDTFQADARTPYPNPDGKLASTSNEPSRQ